jgi:hypothetical protein
VANGLQNSIGRISLEQGLLINLEGQAHWVLDSGLAKGEGIPNYLDFLAPTPLESVAPDAITLVY